MLGRMNALKAHVKNGRLVVDEPTELPEGTVIYLEPLAGDDDMDAEERAALEAAIQEGLDDFEAGRIVSEETIRAKLRAHR
jgi:uridine phosphorylase